MSWVPPKGNIPTHRDVPTCLSLGVDQDLYEVLWCATPESRPRVTPSLFPPAPAGPRPSVIEWASAVDVQPVYLQRSDASFKLFPAVGAVGERFLRPANSEALGPNTYLVHGCLAGVDRYTLKGGRCSEWHMDAILDCGIPLNMRGTYKPGMSLSLGEMESEYAPGAPFEGLVRLTMSAWTSRAGLRQYVSGFVEGAGILGLDSHEGTFGKVSPVPFGTVPSVVSDNGLPVTVFYIDLRLDSIEPPSYAPFPARSDECPAPDFHGLLRVAADAPFRGVELGDSLAEL